MKSKMKILGILMILGGIGLGVYLYFANQRARLEQGKAIDVAADVLGSEHKDGKYYVTLQYTAGDEEITNTVEVEDHVYFSSQEHNKMSVNYDPADPRKLHIQKIAYQSSTGYVTAICIAGLGMIIAVLASRS